MKTTTIATLTAAALLCTAGPAPATERPSAHTAHTGDIVETAVSAGSFRTLVAAVEAAGLVDALRGDGPFTVFAPTDEAFAALPEGTVQTLLQPGNRDQLKRILTFHVVPGRVLAKDLLPVAAARTLSGESVSVGLRVGDANVVRTDIECSNGVIHVIDAVLMPPPSVEDRADKRVMDTVIAAIDQGVPTYNEGDPDGCARIYRDAARHLLHGDDVSDVHRMALQGVLQARAESASDEAWAIRGVFDAMLADIEFEPRMEAPLPEGFPGLGPVGRVVRKTYPGYRAARAEGRAAFWMLFEHIKSNKVAMTAPVEMTMDDNMREQDMAFLYERPNQGSAGEQDGVDVLDKASVTVLSIGMRGRRTRASEALAKRALEARMRAAGVEAAGSWRALGYSSPMVPAGEQFWELQIPVR